MFRSDCLGSAKRAISPFEANQLAGEQGISGAERTPLSAAPLFDR